ncbi:MAG: type II secretion system protein [Phycisphaerae bacterium]
MPQERKARQGFTLIELLVVIAIIALLLTILVPSLTAAREMARCALCRANLHSIGIGIPMYAHDNADWMPPSAVGVFDSGPDNPSPYWRWADFTAPYFDASARRCPTANAGSGPWLTDVPKDGVFTHDGKVAHIIGGGPAIYSRVMDCPSQRDTEHTNAELTWSTGQGNNSWVDYWGAYGQAATDAHPNQPTPARLMDSGRKSFLYSWFRRPMDYCTVFDSGMTDTLWFRTAANLSNSSSVMQAQQHGYYAPHNKSSNALMLDGHVTQFTGKFIQAYNDGSAGCPARSQSYPFDQPR